MQPLCTPGLLFQEATQIHKLKLNASQACLLTRREGNVACGGAFSRIINVCTTKSVSSLQTTVEASVLKTHKTIMHLVLTLSSNIY